MSKVSRKKAERRCRRYRRYRRYMATGFMAGVVTVMLVLVICFGLGSFYSSAQEEPESLKYYKSLEIKDGDSLWSIAEEYMNDNYESIYDYMAELVELNQLEDYEIDHLQEGDYLTVVYYE